MQVGVAQNDCDVTVLKLGVWGRQRLDLEAITAIPDLQDCLTSRPFNDSMCKSSDLFIYLFVLCIEVGLVDPAPECPDHWVYRFRFSQCLKIHCFAPSAVVLSLFFKMFWVQVLLQSHVCKSEVRHSLMAQFTGRDKPFVCAYLYSPCNYWEENTSF